MKRLKFNVFGDTIVEVMIAAALVLGVMGTGYGLARQSLRQTTDDSLRYQALAYGRSQVEFIRNAVAQVAMFETAPESVAAGRPKIQTAASFKKTATNSTCIITASYVKNIALNCPQISSRPNSNQKITLAATTVSVTGSYNYASRGGYDVYTFSGNGKVTVSGGPLQIFYMVVAGGGGGGRTQSIALNKVTAV